MSNNNLDDDKQIYYLEQSHREGVKIIKRMLDEAEELKIKINKKKSNNSKKKSSSNGKKSSNDDKNLDELLNRIHKAIKYNKNITKKIQNLKENKLIKFPSTPKKGGKYNRTKKVKKLKKVKTKK